ncbi:WD domain, G-beta repeat-containing protein [Eremomyces bilateralis CBS 781.70]|uniref:WD domain, G-beta repeat-containing protein n=1 Tax=Eremomyces bilateralis CBS 781.70 TaxID=1392243 RepID=A0A6G1G287_9PEZI|nr:WD domain, G-beta repeat-containing protein [Eremomyces bilateralis CBS 781.70]KAF1812040.1 WD domain, G-beta repeat-containing protein [Eremomyces bilateralis CBS 781.70]
MSRRPSANSCPSRRIVQITGKGQSRKPKPPSRDSDEDEDDSDEDDEDEEDEFPVSHELLVKTHEKAVTSMALDTSGSRLITGSLDCTLKLHDFSSMTPTTVRAFKSVDPTATKASASSETHPIHYVAFNPFAPSQMLVVSATSQPRILDRDGEVLTEFVKGDMYLRDMHHTNGHTAEITGGAWHPTNAESFVTSSADGTLRIWDVNNKRKQKEVIVFRSKAPGSAGRTKMTAVCWGATPDGGQSNLVASALDGSLVMYSGNGPHTRPAAEIRDAHTPGTWTSGLDISSDGRLVVTRGGDDTIKLWDTRNFKQPVNIANHTSTSTTFPTSNIRFSPTSANVITGSETGDLYILNPATLRPELVTPVTPGSPLITVQWHSKLNQILTGSANSEVHVLFNPTLSTAGAKSVMMRAPKRRHIDDDPNNVMDLSQGLSSDAIVAPGGMKSGSQSAMSFAARHPNVGLTASGRSRDPRRPHIPDTTPGSKTQPDEQHIKNSIPLSAMRDEDPREALMKYADKAKNDPMFTKAWKETQPKTIYADLSDEEEPEKKKAKR